MKAISFEMVFARHSTFIKNHIMIENDKQVILRDTYHYRSVVQRCVIGISKMLLELP